jgi:GT2 family glycosyltransferase
VRRAAEAGAQVAGPRLVTAAGTTQRWDHGEADGWRARVALASGNSYWRERSVPGRVAWVSGAAFLIERSCFDALGGFDEKLFLFKEDEELCWRVRARGGTIIYDPTLSVFHQGGVVARKSAHLRRSTDYFLDKHFRDHPGYPVYKLINRLLH